VGNKAPNDNVKQGGSARSARPAKEFGLPKSGRPKSTPSRESCLASAAQSFTIKLYSAALNEDATMMSISRFSPYVLPICLFFGSLAITLPAVGQGQAPSAKDYPFVFRDTGDEAGVQPHVAAIRGHGAGWGDVDGDGWLDLYVATFHNDGSKPNMFFRNNKGKFQLDGQKTLQGSMRATGVVFADLDNDGDPDLYVASMPAGKETKLAIREGRPMEPCTLFRNDGGGKFTNISAGNGACPDAFGGRSVAVLDYDGDGLLDLLVGEDPNPGYNGSKTKSSRLFRNLGKLQFEDVSQAVGLTAGIPGLGVAAGDVNNDGWPDFFLASSSGGNVLFLNDGRGKFREAPDSRKTFEWPGSGGDNMICGACFCDINRDGLLDLVIGQHFSRPWQTPVTVRVYLNRGIKDGVPVFEDVTEEVGMTNLPMKSPHVEVQDFDNDGWPDIYASMVRIADNRLYPVIFRHHGIRDGLPRFRDGAAHVNDFPTKADLAIKKTGDFFDNMVKEKKVIYMAPGPCADYDNDGRLDMFLPNWWLESRSLLLHNETAGGNWLQVQVEGTKGVNRMGIGSRIKIYTVGKSGNAAGLIGCRDVSVGFGYASGQPPITHFGLGTEERVDVEVVLPHGNGVIMRNGVKANERVTLKMGE